MADQAYRQMRSALTGKTRGPGHFDRWQSGAARPKTTKFVMRYLAGLSLQGGSLQGLEARVLQTNPVLEGFGNWLLHASGQFVALASGFL